MQTTYTYDHYFRYGEITEILQTYAREYPDYCRMSSIGTTAQGRSIWLMEITDLSTGDFSHKPGLAVTANIHAGEITGNVCAMFFLDTILTNRQSPEIAGMLKKSTIYCIPRITPDGSELHMTTPIQLRSVPIPFPFEKPMPGLQPKDMDGDGVIRQMRVKDPCGAFKISDKDPRIMVMRKPDDVGGEYYDVYNEGELLEWDPEETVAPAPNIYGNDLNRNFPFHWGPQSEQPGSGSFALSNAETRALAEFLSEHKNLCTILNFHTMGGMYLHPPGYAHMKEVHKEDMDRYKAIGKMAVEETGFVCWNIKDEYMASRHGNILGSFDDFCHFAMGLLDFTCECWDLENRAGVPHKLPNPVKNEDEWVEVISAYLKWFDENNDGEGFLNWTPFHHPQFGDVEIGGFDYKAAIQNAPPKFLREEAEKHTRFLLRELKCLPHLYTRKKKVEKLAEDTYRLEWIVGNESYLPTYVIKEAVKLGRAEPIEITLEGGDVLEGKQKQSIGHLGGFGDTGTSFFLGGTTKLAENPLYKKLSWVVRAKPGDTVTVTASAPRVGMLTETFTL